jgi:hypothetical protein
VLPIAVVDPKRPPIANFDVKDVTVKQKFALDIETYPECGGKLRDIACVEDPPPIAKILDHVRRRQASTGSAARGPPADSHQTLMLT